MDVGRRKTKCGDGYYGGILLRVCGVRGREQESTFGYSCVAIVSLKVYIIDRKSMYCLFRFFLLY